MKTPHFLRPLQLFTLFLIFVTPIGLSAGAEKAGPIKASYTADKVSPSTYVIHGPLASPTPENQGFINNPAFIIGDDGIIVIDAGSTVQVGEMVLALIKKISELPVVATFSTHIHGDHWLGNQAITQAYPKTKHYAHPKMIEQAIAGEGENWVSLMLNLSDGASAGTEFLAPTEKVQEGDKITIAGKAFVVYHDELAHTDNDIALHFEDENVLFLGDTVMNRRLGRLDDGGFKSLIRFLDKMLAVDADVYVPGHGQTGTQEVVETYQQFMQLILSTVQQEYENGLADFEIKTIIEQKIENIEQWSDIEESLGKLVSLAYLEVEEDAF